MIRIGRAGAVSRKTVAKVATSSAITKTPSTATAGIDPPAHPTSPARTFILRSIPLAPSLAHGSRYLHTSPARHANFPFKLHDIGEGIAEVELLKWHVEEGQSVDEFDVLCEVQSDKSTVELTSPTAGVVKRLGAEEGVVVKVGQLICDIETEGDAVVEDSTPNASAEVESAEDEAKRQVEKEESEAVTRASRETEQSGKAAESESHDTSLFVSRDSALDNASTGAQFSGEAAMLPSAPPPRPPTSGQSGQAPVERQERQSWSELKRIVKASPAVRTLAARMDVDLSEVKGTGDGGRVTSDDVRAYAGVGNGQGAASQSSPASMPSARDDVPKTTRVDFGRTRKVMYRAMGDMGSVPHFGYSHTLDLTALLPYMKALNPPLSSDKQGYLASDIPASLVRDPLPTTAREKTTLLSFLVKGLLLAMEEHPVMRSRVKESGGDKWLEVARDATIAVAVSDPKFGLLTPSLPALPPSTPLSSITSHLSALRQNASKPTAPGSLTISSVGALGESKGAMPVLPPGGGVAICAVGRAAWGMEWKVTRPQSQPQAKRRGVWDWTPGEVEEGGTEAVLRCPVGWSGDHRVLEGAELIAFTETWKKYIEEPWRWIKVDA